MMYRFREAMLIETGKKRDPTDPTHLIPALCSSLPAAEQRRQELNRDIGRAMAKIQDINIDEFQIRKLNDDINEMIREKVEWDQRIIELGGVDSRAVRFYDEQGIDMLPKDGKVIGYKYFGRAKELDGIKHILSRNGRGGMGTAIGTDGDSLEIGDRDTDYKRSEQRKRLYKLVDAKYFGWGEEMNDPDLLNGEKDAFLCD